MAVDISGLVGINADVAVVGAAVFAVVVAVTGWRLLRGAALPGDAGSAEDWNEARRESCMDCGATFEFEDLEEFSDGYRCGGCRDNADSSWSFAGDGDVFSGEQRESCMECGETYDIDDLEDFGVGYRCSACLRDDDEGRSH